MRSRRKTCAECAVPLSRDEAALCRKLIDPEAEGFFCLDHLAGHLGCDREDLEMKVRDLKEQGCTLFL